MKKLFIKCTNSILAGIITMLGFSGCWENLEEYGSPPKEYGTPYVDFTVKGTVVNEETQNPISGIRVGYHPQEWNEDVFGHKPEYSYYAYIITNTNGEFTLTRSSLRILDKVPVFIEDIDGEENGLFLSKMIEVDFKDAVQTQKGNEWYNSEFTITTNIELVEAEIEEE